LQPEPTETNTTPVEVPFVRTRYNLALNWDKKSKKYIILLVDYFTKWVESEPTPTVTSNDVILFLLKDFSRHGTQFAADITKAFVDLYGTYIQFVATYHPESNGLTENRNREIGKLLRILSDCNESL